MNILDLVVIGIMLLCIVVGTVRGFLRATLGFVNFVIAIVVTNLFYPYLGRFLRSIDGLFGALTTSISQALNLDELVYNMGVAAQTEVIDSLPLPNVFRQALIENNNPVIHMALGVVDFAGYIAAFLAGIVINIISMIIIFVIVFAALTIITNLLNIISRLPVLNTLNKLLGGVVGGVWGLLLVWLVLGIVVIYFSANGNANMADMLEASQIARPMHDANFVVDYILRLFP